MPRQSSIKNFKENLFFLLRWFCCTIADHDYKHPPNNKFARPCERCKTKEHILCKPKI